VSAIVGAMYLDNRPIEGGDLDRMLESLAHRGADGTGVWMEGSIGLGHRMLWTTPESVVEELPSVHSDGNLVVTADARIDNRDEMIRALHLTDRPSEAVSDSCIIVAAYEQWGERCPERLLGDFAFAIWDQRRQALFCARDHFGVKPFYYHASGRIFAFASEMKALFRLPEVPRLLNEVRVAEFLVDAFHDKAITSYRDILRLPPGHRLVLCGNDVRLEPYWALDPSREELMRSDAAYAERFRDIFTEAVRCRLRTAFPLGSLLSGGLDSSAITCVARDVLRDNEKPRLRTFSAIFQQGAECDERPFIEAVVAQGHLEPYYFAADQLSPLVDRELVLSHEDDVVYGPNRFLQWKACHIAKEHGIRVLLDGFDGDTTVSHGDGYLGELARTGRWIALSKQADGLARNFNQSSWSIQKDFLWHYALRPMADRLGVLPAARRLRRIVPGSSRGQPQSVNRGASHAISRSFATQVGLAERIQFLQRDRSGLPRTVREQHYRNLTWGVMPSILEIMDRSAATFGVEGRYPFWDKRLVEFCLSLPPQQKLNLGWTRVVMRRAMEGILPPEVQWRAAKADFSQNFRTKLLSIDRELLEEIIVRDPAIIAGYVDIDALRRAYSRYVSHNHNEDALTVWKGVTLALWLRRTGLAS
jgi:asparagine synthase (glutamine-hydrolysing)